MYYYTDNYYVLMDIIIHYYDQIIFSPLSLFEGVQSNTISNKVAH